MGYTIKTGYAKIPLNDKLKAYIQLLRPFTLLAPILAGLFGVVAGAGYVSFEILKTAVYVGITLALAQAVGQIVNQAVDAELDKIVKPYRPIPRGLIMPDEAMGLAWILSIIAIGRAFTVSVTFGLYVLILLFFAVFYSLRPLSPRYVNPWLSLAWMSVSRGFLPIIATYTIYGPLHDAIKYGLIGLTWCLAFQGTKDVPDMTADAMFGIKTVANTYGLEGLKIAAAFFLGGLTALIAIFDKPLFLALVVLGAVGIAGMNRPSKLTENTVGWMVFYLGLATIYLLIFIENLYISQQM